MTKHAEIAARLAAATPGPWWSAIDKLAHKRGRKPMDGVVGVGEGSEAKPLAVLAGLPAKQRHPDADFIAHAPSDIAFLLNEITRLEAEVEHPSWLYSSNSTTWPEWAQTWQADYLTATTALAAAEAEVATLREALERITNVPGNRGDYAIEIARSSLATPTATAREGEPSE